LSIALFLGRFQPFHKGHLKAIKWILKKSDKLIIVIGSSNKSFQKENPFTAQERMKMIKIQLKHEKIANRCKICLLTDINNNEKWAKHLDKHVPKYDTVYSNNTLVIKLLKKAGKTVLKIPFFNKKLYNATTIRKKMLKKENWKAMVPNKVAEYLEKINAEERLRKINKTKTKN
jgi:nicotinamide-nucleotide adenylyltransferase